MMSTRATSKNPKKRSAAAAAATDNGDDVKSIRPPTSANDKSEAKKQKPPLPRKDSAVIMSEQEDVKETKLSINNGLAKKYVGAHVSAAGGLHNAPINAASMGARSFALFLKSQRQWASKPLDDQVAEKFRRQCQINEFSPDVILPHGSYLLNCGAPNEETLNKSRLAIVDELRRCEKLGLKLYNFHPGSTCSKITIDDCLDRIGQTINLAHKQTKYVITVVENMSCQGSTVGGDFNELRGIIDRVEDKSRVGICLDTCHAFAAGYDLSTKRGFDKMMQEFENVVGLKYLKALHLNDSKGKLGCHLDRHESIGRGSIGLDGFRRIMNDARFDNMPMILETPYTSDDVYAEEIILLNSLELANGH